ncbi:MAG: efflux RND transporter periplasmic adaptor subunit [Bryobacteraceae bacterium]|nr:efflux RND transporter periplasmic adaptor subunit [Bryobacteraceae bacterium]
MKRGAAALIVCLAAGCQRPAEPPAKVEAAKPEAAEQKAANEVVLDAKMQAQARLRVAVVRQQSLPQTVVANGRLAMNENRTWHVGAVTDGRVIRVQVVPGDRVERDQLLAGLHSHDIHEARAEYRRAMQELTRLQTVLSYSQKQRDRMRRLYELKAASLEQVEHAETEFKNSQTAVQNAETELGRTRSHLVEFLQVPLEASKEHAEGDFDHDDDLIPVKAPEAGVLLERKVTPGSVVTAGEEMFVISDLGTLWMIAAVNEENFGKLRVGMGVKIRVQAYPGQIFSGRITRFGEQLDAETRTVQARVELANPGGWLKPEMYATGEISVAGSESAVFVPQAAVQQVNGQPTVFVQTGADRFEARLVEAGRSLDGQIRIIEGLGAGERVVVEGSYILKSQLLKGSLE